MQLDPAQVLQVAITIAGGLFSVLAAYFSATSKAQVAELRAQFQQQLSTLEVRIAENYVRRQELPR